MSKKNWPVLLAAAILLLSTSAIAQECKSTRLRLSYGSPVATNWTDWCEAFKQEAAKRTSGRVVVQYYSDRQLFGGSPKAEIDGVQDGIADATLTSTLLVGLFMDSRFDLINLPFLFPSHEVANALIDGDVGKMAQGWISEKGLVPIGWGINGFRQLTNSKKSVRTPDDLKGMKIRVAGSRMFIRTFQLLGANPVTMSFSDLYPALQQGVIDGQENPLKEIESSSFYNVQKFVTIWNYAYDPLIMMMNKKSFDGVCKQDQQALFAAATHARDVQRKLDREVDDALPKSLVEKYHMQVVPYKDVDIAAFKSAVAQTIRTEWTPILGADRIKMIEEAVRAAQK